MYATIADLEDRITQARLAGFVPETGSTRTALLNAILSRASALIDGYIGAVYATPAPASGLLQGWALTACVYELHLTRGGPSIPDKIQASYDSLLSDLRAVADGKRSIGGADAPSAGGTIPSAMLVGSDTPQLGTDPGMGMAAW